MQREEKILEDIIQIFHNSKGSIKNNLARWQVTSEEKELPIKVEWQPYPKTPFFHAAGQYEKYIKKKSEQTTNEYTQE